MGRAKMDDVPLIAGAGGAGILLFVLVVLSCVMYARAKKARKLVKEQAFYMSSLSGSQHGECSSLSSFVVKLPPYAVQSAESLVPHLQLHVITVSFG